MCILALMLCALLLEGLFLVGNFTGTKQRVANTLEFQTKLFERQIDTYYDSLAVMSVQLSQNTSDILESYLAENGITFADLNGSARHIENLQESLIDSVRHKLFEADCTGAFVMLDVGINPHIDVTDVSRTGIYLQRNSLEIVDSRVLLYRGITEIGKEHDCMPHRKWRLEFNTEFFPNYSQLKSEASFPLNESYRITNVVELPGTDQHVMLMTVPLLSDDGAFYGICGFELNEGYFKQFFSQPSEFDRAIFCISKSNDDAILSESTTLSAGVLNEYYSEPYGTFKQSPFGSGLVQYTGEDESYIGITEDISLCPSACTSAISVLIPKDDYNKMLSDDIIKIVLLVITVTLSVVALSMYFAKRYLEPIKGVLENIRRKEYSYDTAYSSEINDLFAHLAEQDRLNEEEFNRLRREKTDAVSELQNKIDEIAKQNKRLLYSRKEEIDPFNYELFKHGLKSLTQKEKEVLKLYVEGRKVSEIIDILGLKESTVRFHNKNIYAKLGVHSLKQLLLYYSVYTGEKS